MTTLFEAMNQTATTDNGCVANHSSLSKCVDLFYLAGASRGKDIKKEFLAALGENETVALHILQWLRDVRGGAGERQLFRELLKVAFDYSSNHSPLYTIVDRIPEIGRYDDLLWLVENMQSDKPEVANHCAVIFCNGLKAGNGLAFKWTPIKGDIAKVLRKHMGFYKEADWRKFVVAGRKTVEQQMCANEWDQIEFGKVPSVASARYQKAFGRHAPDQYSQYLSQLEKGEAKINAGAVYPYDITRSVMYGDKQAANAQWKALPNYLEGNKERILPVIDVSGSMDCPAGGNSKVRCVDVAVSLGLYLAEHNEGPFKDIFMTFSANPKLVKVSGTLSQRVDQISRSEWGMNTDLQRMFAILLQSAILNKVSEEEMPTTIIIFSDMMFDRCVSGGTNVSAYRMMADLYNQAGYKLPKIVFWNLNASNKSVPVTIGTEGTALVSGFSPSLMKGLLAGDLEPESVMLKTVMVDRYALF